jgi:hypothetical protein
MSDTLLTYTIVFAVLFDRIIFFCSCYSWYVVMQDREDRLRVCFSLRGKKQVNYLHLLFKNRKIN